MRAATRIAFLVALTLSFLLACASVVYGAKPPTAGMSPIEQRLTLLEQTVASIIERIIALEEAIAGLGSGGATRATEARVINTNLPGDVVMATSTSTESSDCDFCPPEGGSTSCPVRWDISYENHYAAYHVDGSMEDMPLIAAYLVGGSPDSGMPEAYRISIPVGTFSLRPDPSGSGMQLLVLFNEGQIRTTETCLSTGETRTSIDPNQEFPTDPDGMLHLTVVSVH